MEDNLNFLKIIDNFFCQQKIQKKFKKLMQPETLQIKTMVLAPLRVT